MNNIYPGLFFLFFTFGLAAAAAGDEPAIKFHIRQSIFTLVSDSSAELVSIISPLEGIGLDRDTASLTTTVFASGKPAVQARIKNRTPLSLEMDLNQCSGKADLSGVEATGLHFSQKGGCYSLQVLQPSAIPARQIELKVRKGEFRFERMGNLNPVALDAEITGGKAVLDLRGEKDPQWEGVLRLKGGKGVLVCPEKAQISIVASPGALFIARTQGFPADGKGGFFREGTRGNIRLEIESAGGMLSLMTAPDDALLEEVLEEKKRASSDMHFVHFSDVGNWIRYNRVEGLFLGVNYDSHFLDKSPHSLFARAGYAIHQRLVQYELGLQADLDRHFRLPATVTLSAGKKADSEDRWIVSDNENSLQMLLFGDDYRDYFRSDFKSLGGEWRPLRFLTLEGTATQVYYKNLGTTCRFSLLGFDTMAVRWNPAIQERRDHVISASCRYDNTLVRFPRQGVNCYAKAEYSGGRIQSQFTYRRIFTDLRGYYAFLPNLELCTRLYTGEVVSKTGNADIATQKLFDFRGPGTIRGLPFRDDGNDCDKNRILAVNAEIRYLTAAPGGLQPSCLFDRVPEFLLCGFFEAGKAWNTEDNGRSNQSFSNLIPEIHPQQFYKTVGLGLSDRNEHVRVDLSRTFYHTFPWPWDRATIRFGRTF